MQATGGLGISIDQLKDFGCRESVEPYTPNETQSIHWNLSLLIQLREF